MLDVVRRSATRAVKTAVILGILQCAPLPIAQADRPWVDVVEDRGSIDGSNPGRRPQWDRVRLSARLKNRLDVDITDVAVEVRLVRGASEVTVPGWVFVVAVPTPILRAGDERWVHVDRPLLPRKSPPRADEIAYRIRVVRYRLVRPGIETALRLLASRAASDQRAALASFVRSAVDRALRQDVEDELGLTLGALPARPGAPDALRLLVTVAALGALEAERHIATLLNLLERVDPDAWGRSLIELARAMTAASAADEPRLEILPGWARQPPDLLSVRAEDALFDAVRDAIFQMGDRAVAPLIHIEHRDASPRQRERARRLLAAIGRSTVAAQLRVKGRTSRIKVIRALGQASRDDAIRPLARLAMKSENAVRTEAQNALVRIGPSALAVLIEQVGLFGADALLEPLEKLGARSPQKLSKLARKAGLAVLPTENVPALIARIRAKKRAAHRASLRRDLHAALELGGRGSYRRALEALDRIYADDPELYARFSPAIAKVYAGRARRFLDRGDFDAAVATAQAGRAVFDLEALRLVLFEARSALVRGYLELGELDRAAKTHATLKTATAAVHRAQARDLERELVVTRARRAYERGEKAKARAFLERARALTPDHPDVQTLERDLLVAQNASLILLFAGLGLVAALFAIAALTRVQKDRNLRRLTR